MLELATLALMGLFVVSAIAKLADRAGARRAIVEFGAPERIAGALSGVVIGAELAVAAALLSGRLRVAGALGALVLMGLFSAVIGANLAIGRTAECRCFGRLSTGPVGWSAVARNLLVASVAAYVASGTGGPLFGAVALAAIALWLGSRQVRSIRRGAKAPAFSLSDGASARWTLDRLLAGKRPVLLVFSQPGCGACTALEPELARWHAGFKDRVTVAVIGGASQAGVAEYPVLVDEQGSVARGYGVTATPSAVLVDRRGRIAAGTARGADEIEALVVGRFEVRDEPRFSRRVAVMRAARGVASLGALPLVASACGSGGTSKSSATGTGTRAAGRPTALHVGEVYLCHQRYALCTNAPCVKSPHDPKIAICDCVVKTGYSVGFHSCERRAPHGKTLYSEFSTQLVTSSTHAMTCPKNIPWANCLDGECELDPKDPSKARCKCPLVAEGPAFTFGGDCDTRTCSSTIWSGSSPKLGTQTATPAVVDHLKQLGQPLVLPPPCPKS